MRRESDPWSDSPQIGERPESVAATALVDRVEADRVAETLIDVASEAFVLVDEESEILFANRAIADILGYEPAALVGQQLLTLVPERLRDAHREGFGSYLETGERTLDWNSVELPGQHRDGHEVPLLISFREFTHDQCRYFVGVMRDVSDQVQRREELSGERAFVDSMFDALPDIVYAFDQNGQLLRWNEVVNEVTGYTDAEIESLQPLDFIPESDHQRISESIYRVMNEGAVETIESRLVTKDGTEIPYEFTGAPLVEDGEIIGETGVGRDVTERKRREERLERLDELNTVIRSVDRALVESTTREEIARTVSDRLVDEGAYSGALVGRFDDEQMRVVAAAGVDHAAVEVLAPSGDGRRSLARTAVASRDVEVLEGVSECDVDVWRENAQEQGYRTVAAVPLVANDRVFGVLGVYSDESTDVSERERTVLGELGRTIGNAIQAALTQQLLYSNTVTEIELRTTNPNVAFVTLSADADCRLDIERVISFGAESVFYVTATAASLRDVEAAASNLPASSSVEHLGTDGGDHLFEVRTDGGTLTTVLTDRGARTKTGEADRGEVRVLAELPPDAAVREVVDAVQDEYPGTELLARREVERSLRTPVEFRRELAADLTDKQRGALEAAYFAGYFEWPARTNTAEEVAATLDISSQTFHQHLRIAERKLLSALFQDDVDGRPA